MAEPIDYLKTYLNMNPEDYSRMQAQIGGETLPEREVFTMPARAMPMPMPMPAPRQAMEPMPMPAPQNTEVQGLMDEIASLKAQIQAMQDTSEPMPAVEEAPVMPSAPAISDLQNRMAVEPMPLPTINVPQAPAGITNRMVGEPQLIPSKKIHIDRFPRKSTDGIASISDAFNNPVVSEQIQKSLDMLSNLPKTNIPIIPDMEEIRQKMADANIPFSTPISFEEQLQTIKDLPPMQPVTPMPQAIKQPSRSGIFGNLLDRVQKQIEVPKPPSMPVSPMLQTKPAPFMPVRPRNMLDIQQRFAPQRFAGGGLSKALSELKTRIS